MCLSNVCYGRAKKAKRGLVVLLMVGAHALGSDSSYTLISLLASCDILRRLLPFEKPHFPFL